MSEAGSGTSARKLLDRPTTLRKSCDLCHLAKQKCSQTKPSCLRCTQSGWNCVYTARARRRPPTKKPCVEPTANPTVRSDRPRPERNGSDAGSSGLDFLPEQNEQPEAGPSRLLNSPVKRPHKRRKGGEAYDLDVTYSYSEGKVHEAGNGLPKSRGEGGGGFVRRNTKGKELLMTAKEYLRCIQADGHLDGVDLLKFLQLAEPSVSAPTPTPVPLALPVQVENVEIDKMIMESISEELPADVHVHSDPYDEQPFEEEDVELDIGTTAIQEDGTPPHIHFAVEESADMRFFARSNSMPPVSSLPPLEMTSLLASQAAPYSPRSHYLTEGLDLAASNRTPTVSSFDDAAALVRPFANTAWNATIPMPKPYDPQTIISQSHYASSPLTTPPVESRDPRPPSEMSTANWEFVGLGQATAYRSHSSLQRAHSVPQSPFPTQHFGSIPHVTGPVSVVGDFGPTDGTEFPAPSPYAVETVINGGLIPRHGDGHFLATSGGLMNTRDSPDVDVDMSGLLNTEMEEDENGIRQVTVVNIQSNGPAGGDQDADDGLTIVCHHEADISHTLFALDALGRPGEMSLISVFPHLTRSLEILLAATLCAKCATSPLVTLGQLALLSRTCDVLRYPHPITPSPLPLIIAGGRTTMTGLAPEIEVHIIDVIWATWRGSSIQKICSAMKKQANETLIKVQEEESRRKAEREEVDELGDDDEEFTVEGASPKKPIRSAAEIGQYVVREVNGVVFHEQVTDTSSRLNSSAVVLEVDPRVTRALFIVQAIEILSRIPSK